MKHRESERPADRRAGRHLRCRRSNLPLLPKMALRRALACSQRCSPATPPKRRCRLNGSIRLLSRFEAKPGPQEVQGDGRVAGVEGQPTSSAKTPSRASMMRRSSRRACRVEHYEIAAYGAARTLRSCSAAMRPAVARRNAARRGKRGRQEADHKAGPEPEGR